MDGRSCRHSVDDNGIIEGNMVLGGSYQTTGSLDPNRRRAQESKSVGSILLSLDTNRLSPLLQVYKFRNSQDNGLIAKISP